MEFFNLKTKKKVQVPDNELKKRRDDAALRDHGVPTWQDISHMPSAQTEEELRKILSDKATASAVLFVTPEVEISDFIRNVEAPLVFERYLMVLLPRGSWTNW